MYLIKSLSHFPALDTVNRGVDFNTAQIQDAGLCCKNKYQSRVFVQMTIIIIINNNSL